MLAFVVDFERLTKDFQQTGQTINVRQYIIARLHTKLSAINAIVVHSELSDDIDDNKDKQRVALVNLMLADNKHELTCVITVNDVNIIEQYLHNEDCLSMQQQNDKLVELEHLLDNEQAQEQQEVRRTETESVNSKPNAEPSASLMPTDAQGNPISQYVPVLVKGKSAASMKDWVRSHQEDLEAIGKLVLQKGMPTVTIDIAVDDKLKN